MLIGTIVFKDAQGNQREYAYDSHDGFSVTGMTSIGATGTAKLLEAELLMRPFSTADGEPGAAFLVEKAEQLGGTVRWPPDRPVDPAADVPIY